MVPTVFPFCSCHVRNPESTSNKLWTNECSLLSTPYRAMCSSSSARLTWYVDSRRLGIFEYIFELIDVGSSFDSPMTKQSFRHSEVEGITERFLFTPRYIQSAIPSIQFLLQESGGTIHRLFVIRVHRIVVNQTDDF